MSDLPKFNIGDEVFVAEASAYDRIEVPCPICFGDCFVQLILGNGETETIECSGCGHGYEGPRGVVTRSTASSRVRQGTITGVSRGHFGDGWRYEVGGYGAEVEHIFRTAEEAEAKRAEMFDEAVRQAQENFDAQMQHKKKSHAWSVRYHKDCIKDAERKIAWHTARLARSEEVLAKRKAKESKA